MTRYITILSTALTGLLLLTACHREAPIVSELGTPRYEIKDGAGYVDHTIYDIYKRTGLQVVYHFDPGFATWNLGGNRTNALRYTTVDPAKPEDMQMVEENLRFMEQNFLSRYSDDFIRKYFPVHFYMADTISRFKKGNEILTTSLQDHLAMNMYREGEVVKQGSTKYSTREEVLREMAPQLHATLWGFVFAYRVSTPETFATYSADFYGKNIGPVKKLPGTNEEDLDNRNQILRSHGFWSYDDYNTFAQYRALKDPSLDVADYIYRMATMSETEIYEAMAGYDIMKEKYEALRKFIQERTGMDPQSIGDAASQDRAATPTK